MQKAFSIMIVDRNIENMRRNFSHCFFLLREEKMRARVEGKIA